MKGIADVLEHEHERHVVGFGVHRNIAERSDTIASTCGLTTMRFVNGLNDQACIAAGNEFVKTGLAGDGENSFLHVIFELLVAIVCGRIGLQNYGFISESAVFSSRNIEVDQSLTNLKWRK